MSQTAARRSSAKENRTLVPEHEEALSPKTTLEDSRGADGTHQNDIRLRAYEIYCQHEGQSDRAIDDWLQAEREQNKALVLQAFDTLFNKRDYAAAERLWSPNYIQHSAHIPPGRDGLFGLVRSLPANMRYENGPIVAEGDCVFVHGRFSNIGAPTSLITVDIVRIENGKLAEHWDVWQDEATQANSKSGLPMFGNSFTK